PRQLDHLATFEGNANLLEERLDHVLGLALVEADLLEHQVGELGLCKSDFFFHVRGLAWNCWSSSSRMEATTASTSESVKVLSVSCITIRSARLFLPGWTPFPRYMSNTSTSRTKAGMRPRTAARRVATGTVSATVKA